VFSIDERISDQLRKTIDLQHIDVLSKSSCNKSCLLAHEAGRNTKRMLTTFKILMIDR